MRRIAEVALRLGHEVHLFLMDGGVFHLPSLKYLVDQGAHLALCAHNAYQRGLAKDVKVLLGGQYDWAEMVHDSYRVIVFG